MSAEPDWSSMTVNERLLKAHLMDEFELAAGAKDRARMIDILARVDVSAQTADAILADPRKYGLEQ
jgi:hypothetical protein